MPVIKVIGKPNCPMCDRAKQLLTMRDIDFVYVDASTSPSAMEKLTSLGVRSVPAIFLTDDREEDIFMGGYKELSDYIRQSGGN